MTDIFEPYRSQPEINSENVIHHSSFLLEEASFQSHAFVCWELPTDLQTLHLLLRSRIERTLLAELCAFIPEKKDDTFKPFSKLLFLLFPSLPDVMTSIKAFGFKPYKNNPTLAPLLFNVRGEAQRESIDIPEEPHSIWKADFQHSCLRMKTDSTAVLELADRNSAPASTDEDVENYFEEGERRKTFQSVKYQSAVTLEMLNDQMCFQGVKLSPWGAEPGKYFERLNQALGHFGISRLKPTLEGFREMEQLLLSLKPEVLRWIPSAVFLGLCDMVALIIDKSFELDVQWADCTSEDDELLPPPLIRVNFQNKWIHIPVALQLLRWYIMPLQQGENPDSLADWLLDQFSRS